MKLFFIFLSVSTLVRAENLQKPEKSETCKTKACEKPDPVVTNDQDSKKTNIAPCGACNTLVKSFQFQVAKSDSSDFESVKRKTCSDVPRSPSQCKENLKKYKDSFPNSQLSAYSVFSSCSSLDLSFSSSR